MRSALRWIAALLLAPAVLLSSALLTTKTDLFGRWVMTKERSLARYGDSEIEALPSMIWAHRGLRGPNAPPNTAQAMRAAAEAGFSAVEMDLRWRDGALVVAHGADEPGQPFATVVKGVSPGHTCGSTSSSSPSRWRARARRACDVSCRSPLRARTFIESSSLPALAVLRTTLPGTRSIYTTRSWQRSRFSLGYVILLFAIEWHEISVLGFPAAELSPEVAKALARIGIFTWTTNDSRKLAQQRALGVDVILTDRLPAAAP